MTPHSDRYQYSHLFTRFLTAPCETSTEINIMTRAFIHYMLGTCIFTNLDNTVPLSLLKSLEKVPSLSLTGVVQPWPWYADTWIRFHVAP